MTRQDFGLAFVHGEQKDQRTAYRFVRTTTKHFASGDRTLDVVEWYSTRADAEAREQWLREHDDDTTRIELSVWQRSKTGWHVWER